MTRFVLGFSMISLAGLLTACSGAGVADGGTGSGTFAVDANVSAENRVVNATRAADFDVSFTVRLAKNGAAVRGATVKLESDNGETMLIERDQDGRYEGAQVGYAGSYALSAVLGDDHVEGVVLSGPAAHSFATPDVGQQHPYGTALDVAWSPTGANAATIETRELDHLAITDSGTYTIPVAGVKKPDPGKTEDERVRVTRSASVPLAGAIAGSTLSVSVRNEVSFLVVGP